VDHEQVELGGDDGVGQVDGARRGLSGSLASMRADLRDALPPEVLAEAVQSLQLEQARLEATAKSVALVADALRGIRHRPRL